MPNSALFEISKPSSLRDSWDYIVRTSTSHSRNTKGIDGLSINDIGSKRDRFLLSLSKQIRDTSGYQYDDLRSVLLPKPNGKFRVICVPTVQDRIVQRSVLDFLSVNDKCKLINKVSYGFVRDRTVQDAAKRACKLRKKKPWVYKTDITDFFNSVPRKELFEELDKVIKHTTLLNLLKSAVNCEIFEPNNYRAKKIKKNGIHEGKGIRQGMPLSPFFANILLKDFDRAIEKANLSMVRYADDLIILAMSEAECIDIHNFCKKELAKLSLSIPDPGPASKTQIYSPTKTAEFLGVGIVINGHDYVINILEAQTQTIRDRIFSFSDFSKLVKEGVTIAKLGQRMEGMISGYLAAYSYCMNVAQLEMALNKTRSDTLKKIYVKDLGMDLSSLSEEKMRFLGLVSDI